LFYHPFDVEQGSLLAGGLDMRFILQFTWFDKLGLPRVVWDFVIHDYCEMPQADLFCKRHHINSEMMMMIIIIIIIQRSVVPY
jgi:hypothetical protein